MFKGALKFFGLGIVLGVLLLAVMMLGAWSFMLTVGAAHIEWWPAIPLLGYREALLITFGMSPTIILVGVVSFLTELSKKR